MVRTTKTGGVKMIYDGTPVEVNGKKTCPNTGTASRLANISVFNPSSNSPAYVGYMYGNRVYSIKEKYHNSASLEETGILYGNDVEWTGTEYRLKAKPSESLYSSTGTWNTDRTSIGDKNHYTCFNKEGKCSTVSYIYYTGSSVFAYYIDLSGGTKIEKVLERMHKNEQPSTIKTTIENWFETSNLNTSENLKKIEDTVYCNDRSVADTNNGWSKDGNATNWMYYSSYPRQNHGTPDLSCRQTPGNRDRFTYKDTVDGNGLLKYPVGLLTADEINLAGGIDSISNSDYYLNTGEEYWSFSPSFSQGDLAFDFYVYIDGALDGTFVEETYGIRPVVSLASGIELTGLGTVESPFEVK